MNEMLGTPRPELASSSDGGSAVSNSSITPQNNLRNAEMEEIDREVAMAMEELDPAGLGSSRNGSPAVENLAPGVELVGTISGLTDSDIFVQFGVKSQGVMPRTQFGKKEPLSVGRRVDCVVEKYDEESGLLMVSRKGAVQRATWTNLTVGMIVEGRATGLIKGGLEVDLKGVRAFMPASQVDHAPMKDISTLLNQNVRCEVIELDRRHKSVIVSRRKVQEKEAAENREKIKAEIEPGQVRKGIVRSITDFGAFVDLGGVDGLVHIRDLSWGMVAKVTDVISAGQSVEVMVLRVDREKDRISLGLKQVTPDPWKDVSNKYPVGTSLKARILRIAEFGAFAELEPGVDGLIPISEMGWTRTKKTSDAVSVGGMVDCVVIRVEEDKHRIALSMKQVQEDPWAGVLDSFSVNSLVSGKVTRIADFGAFVEIAPGIEGMVHISEMADHRVKSCNEVVQVGQDVETRVLGVDRENRRISLSIKAVQAPTVADMEAVPAGLPQKSQKKRKKPLRGGLSSHFEW
ncbi:MAG: S1 RNA-binding domain-containing protein [Planctomycetes bacterium]|nr:S1 RNA-binding domain-containing protein [Planctomycetota bacterium]